MERPIFFDASGRRNRWTIRSFLGGLLLLVVTAAVFAATLINAPILAALRLSMERPSPKPISQQVNHSLAKLSAWLPKGVTASEQKVNQLKVGFYVPWDDASRASLALHINELDWLVAGLISVTGSDHHLTVYPDHPLEAMLGSTAKPPAIVSMVQNVLGGKWDGAGMAALLHDAKARGALLDVLEPHLKAQHAIGVMFHFEDLPASAQGNYLKFLGEANIAIAPR